MLSTASKDRSAPVREVRAHTHRPLDDKPDTPGGRMTQRRKELHLRQEDVANQIKFVRKDGQESTMSRSAYCMYEADSVTMDTDRVALIARVLKTTPEFLAYGVTDENAVMEVEFSNGEFVSVKKWSINDDWLYERFEAEAADLALIQSPDGAMAVVRLGVKPGASAGDYVFGEGGKAKFASVVRPSRNANYTIVGKDGKHIRELDESITFLGKVIGHFG